MQYNCRGHISLSVSFVEPTQPLWKKKQLREQREVYLTEWIIYPLVQLLRHSYSQANGNNLENYFGETENYP